MCGAGAAIFGFTDSLANPPSSPAKTLPPSATSPRAIAPASNPAGQVAEDLVERMAAGGVVTGHVLHVFLRSRLRTSRCR
jgi:hypothetical protein